ncbi:hypothetical protein HYPSUDRAFT_210037 [Hypholoma sublateritium FD-334 SS-4]|uniref:Uncharacterized protein n=1 Tax=Hypholoma sublateritium (strain FD-334 SS-4) TaxID=945553 RepID=A0A0D2KEB7_HYPSF|nr:hypothetical protein HYPSUDRAFT_210037 [Hypholoma sublateritium FD-334 SS-4]
MTLGEADAVKYLRLAGAAALRTGKACPMLRRRTAWLLAGARKDGKSRNTDSDLVYQIAATKCTYASGQQEVDDIYLKPAVAPANLLGSVDSNSKEIIVPPAERRKQFDASFMFLSPSPAPVQAPSTPVEPAHAPRDVALECKHKNTPSASKFEVRSSKFASPGPCAHLSSGPARARHNAVHPQLSGSYDSKPPRASASVEGEEAAVMGASPSESVPEEHERRQHVASYPARGDPCTSFSPVHLAT